MNSTLNSLSAHCYRIEYLISDKKRIIEMLKTTVVFEFSIFVNMERYSFGIIRFILFGFRLTYQSLSVCWLSSLSFVAVEIAFSYFNFIFSPLSLSLQYFFVALCYPNLFASNLDIYPATQMTIEIKPNQINHQPMKCGQSQKNNNCRETNKKKQHRNLNRNNHLDMDVHGTDQIVHSE